MSAVQQFYEGTTVLITGGSGFLGKVLIWKLLKACPQLHQVVLLLRAKRGIASQQRLDMLLDDPIFKEVSQENRQKVTVVAGDCQLPDLGLSDLDRQNVIETVNVVFHVAASVNFDMSMTAAVAVNVGGIKAILDLSREISNLKAFVHVSTAYSHCDRDHVDERFYPPKYNPVKLMRLAEVVEEPYLSQLTPLMMRGIENTYIYSKGAAEELVRTHSHGMPVCVFRPSIVISTRSEPVPGWADNLNGAAGFVVATITGAMWTIHCDPSKLAEVVPVDMTVNALIAAAWKTHTSFEDNRSYSSDPMVFNFVSSPERPLSWRDFLSMSLRHHLPSVHTVWVPGLWFTRHRIVNRVRHVLMHLLPAYTVDTAARALGTRTGLVRVARKVGRMTDVMSFFMTRDWTFSNHNVQQLWLSLSTQDQQLFPFSFTEFDWEGYFKTYMLGVRQYLLRDDLTTLPSAESRYKRLYWVHNTLKMLFWYVVVRLAWRLLDISSAFLMITDLVLGLDNFQLCDLQ